MRGNYEVETRCINGKDAAEERGGWVVEFDARSHELCTDNR